mgnify:CR=1 FL=1
MALTPNDIRNCELSTQMRGYHKEEVDDLLEAIATAMEADKQTNLKLSMEIDNLKQQLSALREHEDIIKGAAIDARRNADQAIRAAKAEAEQVLSSARAESERIMASHRQSLAENEDKVKRAEKIKNEYLAQLRDLIESHLGLVADVDIDTPELPQPAPQEPEYSDETAEAPQMSDDETSALDSVLPSQASDEDNIEVTDSSEVDRDTMETVGSERNEEEPEAAEEANAAGKIVEVGRAPEPGDQSSQPPAPAQAEPQTESAPVDQAEEPPPPAEGVEKNAQEAVDPELAEALKAYQDKVKKSGDSRSDDDTMPPAPRGQTYEEANPSGEAQTPPGFVTAEVEANQQVKEATDRVPTQPAPSEPTAAAPPKASIDEPRSDVSPDKLAEELDAVVAKFEEEMDRAAQNK